MRPITVSDVRRIPTTDATGAGPTSATCNAYVELVESERSTVITETKLTEGDRQAEAVFLGLRMMDGLRLSEYQRVFGRDIREENKSDLARFRDAGLDRMRW